jgi:hypothetical protein
MPSSGMLRCVDLVRTTQRNIPEYDILHSQRCEKTQILHREILLIKIERKGNYGSGYSVD